MDQTLMVCSTAACGKRLKSPVTSSIYVSKNRAGQANHPDKLPTHMPANPADSEANIARGTNGTTIKFDTKLIIESLPKMYIIIGSVRVCADVVSANSNIGGYGLIRLEANSTKSGARTRTPKNAKKDKYQPMSDHR